ncbi:MAG: hypothetical protein ACREIV_17205, partial [Planctomycetaceae bacterium]
MLIVSLAAARAEDEPKEDWQPYFRELAASYRIVPESTPQRPLTLLEPPVLRWSQPVRGGDDGALYVWLKDGEPAVVGTMFCWPHRDGYRVVVNEFHSLLAEPLTAFRGEAEAWSPREKGIEWKSFDDAPPPAKTAALRLVQMRRLADRFRGENLDDSTGQTWKLRLLRQPLYRFDRSEAAEPKQGSTLDGALFTLASGTDPEILVLIAARTKEDQHQWQ